MNHRLDKDTLEKLDFMSDHSSEAGELDKYCFESKFDPDNLDDTLEDEFEEDESSPEERGVRL